jgi:hypothetical protein
MYAPVCLRHFVDRFFIPPQSWDGSPAHGVLQFPAEATAVVSSVFEQKQCEPSIPASVYFLVEQKSRHSATVVTVSWVPAFVRG